MRTDVTEAVNTCKLCLLCRCTNSVSVLNVSGLLVIFEDSGEFEGAVVTSAGALQLNSHHLISSHIDRSIKSGCIACRSVNGRESHREYEGEGEKGL